MTQHGNSASGRYGPNHEPAPTARPRGLEELTEHAGLAAAVTLAQFATDPRSLPQVPSETAPVDLPAAGQQANARRPRRLVLWERLLIVAVTSAFAALAIIWLLGIRLIQGHGLAHVVVACRPGRTISHGGRPSTWCGSSHSVSSA